MQRFSLLIFCLLLASCQVSDLTSELDIPLIISPTAEPTPTPEPTPTMPPTPQPYSAAGFAGFAAAVESARIADKPALINDYMARLPLHPLTDIDTGEAVFIWRGSAQNVAIIGDMNNWDNERAWPLTHFVDTDTWYLQVPLDPAARLDYKFLIDGQQEMLDPLNLVTRIRPEGPRSELVMPAYERPPELTPMGLAMPAGTVTQETLESAALGQNRTLFVYEPAVPPTDGAYPVVYINDGTSYLTLFDAAVALDRLIALEEIEPLIAVFIPPIDRLTEYDRNEAYTQFVAAEARPFINQKYNVTREAAQTAVLGVGLGGQAALVTALTRPDLFGLVAAHSADITAENEALSRRLRVQAPLPIQLHLVVGNYEGDVNGRDILGANQRLNEVLTDRGYDYAYEERPQGHSWGLWEATFGDALRYFFGR